LGENLKRGTFKSQKTLVCQSIFHLDVFHPIHWNSNWGQGSRFGR